VQQPPKGAPLVQDAEFTTADGTKVNAETGEILEGGEPDDLDIGDEADAGQPEPPPTQAPARPPAPQAKPATSAPAKGKKSGVSF
jgi:hypothetical protein